MHRHTGKRSRKAVQKITFVTRPDVFLVCTKRVRGLTHQRWNHGAHNASSRSTLQEGLHVASGHRCCQHSQLILFDGGTSPTKEVLHSAASIWLKDHAISCPNQSRCHRICRHYQIMPNMQSKSCNLWRLGQVTPHCVDCAWMLHLKVHHALETGAVASAVTC